MSEETKQISIVSICVTIVLSLLLTSITKCSIAENMENASMKKAAKDKGYIFYKEALNPGVFIEIKDSNTRTPEESGRTK